MNEDMRKTIEEARENERERCARLICPHTDEKGTGKGIYDLQYKECCRAAEMIRTQKEQSCSKKRKRS